MSNCRNHFRKQIITDVQRIAKGNSGTIKVNDTKVEIPFGSKAIPHRDNALMAARRIAKEANDKYFANTYGAVAFVDNTKEKSITITIAPSSQLLDAYEVKYGKQEVLFQLDEKNVNFQLKVSEALKSDKVRNPKSNLQGFYNDLQKQGVPNQQIEIIKDIYNSLVNERINSLEKEC